MRIHRMISMVLFAAALAACRALPSDQTSVEKARLISDLEARVAIAKIGVVVCRDFPIGVSEHNWVKGHVTVVQGDEIVVTIDDPGRFPMDVGTQRLGTGIQLKDTPRSWTPCI